MSVNTEITAYCILICVLFVYLGMNKKQITRIVRDMGTDQRNAYRIVHESKGIAAQLLVRLIQYMIDKGYHIPEK